MVYQPPLGGAGLDQKKNVSHEKKNGRILSIESWLITRDPYKGLL